MNTKEKTKPRTGRETTAKEYIRAMEIRLMVFIASVVAIAVAFMRFF